VISAARLSDEEESSSNSSAVVSQSESEEDFEAASGFEEATWRCVFNSALPRDQGNACDPPPSTRRRARRSDGSSSSSSSDSDGMQGAPEFAKNKRQPRASNSPRDCKTPAQFIELLFPNSVVDNLVACSNAAAREHPRLVRLARYANWRELTRKEMWEFLAICAYLGVVKIQSRRHIWSRSSVFAQPWVAQRMSLRRFECILNSFNCCRYWNLSNEEFEARNAANCFWQISELVEECNKRCAFHFKMGRAFSIDEAVIPWKGRHKARCYNPSKPHKYHLKKFSLNCSATGYVFCHYHYAGKDERRPPHIPASLWPVQKLVDMCPKLHNKNHICATDNWYTSGQSLVFLRSRGIHCTGTIKKSRLSVASYARSGFPSSATFKPVRGQPKRPRAECMIHSTQVNGHPAYVTTWQDKKPVLILSSYPPYAGECTRRIKVGGAWTRQRFFRPNVVEHYNKTMGGTDLHDMRLAHLRTTIKTRRWQVRRRVFYCMVS
jgi:hypothetical protein